MKHTPLLFTFCLLLFSIRLAAQFNFTAQSTSSTCSANGTITVSVSGNGTLPYNFLLDGVPKSSANNNSYTYQGLEPGTYQVKVVDSSVPQQITEQTITVAGNYMEPELTCVINDCDIIATVAHGKAPYQYALSTVSANGPFSSPQSSNIFQNVPIAQVCYVRVTDSCNNFYTRVIELGLEPISAIITCTPLTDSTYEVAVGNLSGGNAPYTITCSAAAGVTFNNSGVFSNLKGCSYEITLTDHCGRVSTVSKNSCIVPQLKLECLNCAQGTMQLSATGGKPPYTFNVNTGMGGSSINSASGLFSNLPPPNDLETYTIRVTDACSNAKIKTAVCPLLQLSCMGNPNEFAGQVGISLNSGYLMNNPFFPLQITGSNSTSPNNTATINNASQLPIVIDGFPSGNQEVNLTNNCSDSAYKQGNCAVVYSINMVTPAGTVSGGTGSGAGSPSCGNSLQMTILTPNCTYQVYTVSPYALYSSNTTGLFPMIPPNIYECTILSPSGFPLVTEIFNTELYFTQVQVGCQSVLVGACPSNLVFSLYNVAGTLIVWGNTSGIFNNLQPNTKYKVVVTNPSTNATASKWVRTLTVGELSYKVMNCDSVYAEIIPLANNQVTSPAIFTLTNTTTGGSQQNSTGIFNNLSTGVYILTASVGDCGTQTRTFNIGLPYQPAFCIKPKPWNGQLVWMIETATNHNTLWTSNGLTSILSDSISPNLFQYYPLQADSTYLFLSRNCETYTFTLPAFLEDSLYAYVSSTCLNLACIQAGGGKTKSDWESWIVAAGFSPCIMNHPIRYRLFDLVNQQFIGNGGSSSYCNLPIAGTYRVYLERWGLFIDSVNLFIPPYQQPNLSGNNGYTCAGSPFGTIQLQTTGNGYPFQFELLNPPAGYSTTLQNTTGLNNSADFANLPDGIYNFMVYDACGVSSDFSAAIQPFAFNAKFQRFCNGFIQLEVPYFEGATYSWTDENGNIVGDSCLVFVPDIGAQTYTLNAQGGVCTFTTSIYVPYATNPMVPISAGNNASYNFTVGIYPYNFTLTGSTPPATFTSLWQQLTTDLHTATINSPFATQTSVMVLDTGVYHFIYLFESSQCIAADTVTISILDCLQYQPLAFRLVTEAEGCLHTSADGKAEVEILAGEGPFSYSWSTGATTPSINQLTTGVYSVTVRDEKGCYYFLDLQQKEFAIAYHSLPAHADFSSNPTNQYPIMLANAAIEFQNHSQNANTYSWVFGHEGLSEDFEPSFTFYDTGHVVVSLYAANAYCEDVARLSYYIVPNGAIWVPTAFSPNGDNKNDIFYVRGIGVVAAEIAIYSRWGECIYYSEDLAQGWGGTFHDKDVPEGVYTVRVKAKLENGKLGTYVGTITLIR